MRHIFWLELKRALRSPLWLLIFVFVSGMFFTNLAGGLAPQVYISLDRPLLGYERMIFSVGEWGRALFLILEMFGGVVLSLLTALITTSVLSIEPRYKEVLSVTPRSVEIRYTLARCVAISVFVFFIYVLGASVMFLNPLNRETIVIDGLWYLPIYFFITWLRILIWVVFAELFFVLTRSQWAPAAIVFALHAVSFGTAGIWGEPNLLRVLHRSFISWGFASVFAPFGLIPRLFVCQILMLGGLIFAVAGASLWLHKRFPEQVGVNLPWAKTAFFGGLLLSLGAISYMTSVIRANTAPFTAADLWEGEARLERPYIWTKDYRLLWFPGQYKTLVLPPNYTLPAWLDSSDQQVTLFETAGSMILEGHLYREERIALAKLILIYPSQNPYPEELKIAIEQYIKAVYPMLKELSFMLERLPKPVFVWPEDLMPSSIPSIRNGEFLFGPACILGTKDTHITDAILAVSNALGVDRATRVYLLIYFYKRFLGGKNEEEVDKALHWLSERAKGGKPEPTKALRLFFHPASWTVEEAQNVLNHWENGERLGHDNYIIMLLKKEEK